MPQGKNVAVSLGQSSRVAKSGSPLHFDPERALAAIAYHLIDDGITRLVTQDSMQRAVNRLRRESFGLTISARTWAVMTNSARLRRLLDETGTEAALLPDDTATLIQRRLARR